MSDMNTDIRCDRCDRPAEGVYLRRYNRRYYCRLHGGIVCLICMRWAAAISDHAHVKEEQPS